MENTEMKIEMGSVLNSEELEALRGYYNSLVERHSDKVPPFEELVNMSEPWTRVDQKNMEQWLREQANQFEQKIGIQDVEELDMAA